MFSRSVRAKLRDAIVVVAVIAIALLVAMWAVDRDRLWFYLNAYAQLWLAEW